MEMSQRQYQRIENGEVELNMSKLDEICKLLEITLEQLLGFEEQFIFNHCSNNTNVGGKDFTINVQLPNDMLKIFFDRITHLENEVNYFRELLKSKE